MAKKKEEKVLIVSVSGMIDRAKYELDTLKGEYENWRDNITGTGLENAPVYEALGIAIDNLDSVVSDLENLSIPERIDNTTMSIVVKKRESRQKRFDECLDWLRDSSVEVESIRDSVDDEINELEEEPETILSKEEEAEREGKLDDLKVETDAVQTYFDELESIISDLEGIELPIPFNG